MIDSDPLFASPERYTLRLVKMFWSKLNKKYARKRLENNEICTLFIEGARRSNNDSCVFLDVCIINNSEFTLHLRDLHIDAIIENFDYQGFPLYAATVLKPYERTRLKYPIFTGKINFQSDHTIQVSQFDFMLTLYGETVKKDYSTREHTKYKIALK